MFYCIYLCACACVCLCHGVYVKAKGQLSFSPTMWVLGIELRLVGLAAGAFPHWAPSMALIPEFWNYLCKSVSWWHWEERAPWAERYPLEYYHTVDESWVVRLTFGSMRLSSSKAMTEEVTGRQWSIVRLTSKQMETSCGQSPGRQSQAHPVRLATACLFPIAIREGCSCLLAYITSSFSCLPACTLPP